MNLASAFALSSEKQAANPGLFWGDTELTYRELFHQSLQVSAILHRTAQLQPGARVGIWLKNCPEFVGALFGTWLAQGVVVPINNFLRPREVGYILENAGIDVLISETALSEGFGELKSLRPGLRIFQIEEFETLEPTGTTAWAHPPQTESDLALIIYTSGTTGHPKGVLYSHRSWQSPS